MGFLMSDVEQTDTWPMFDLPVNPEVSPQSHGAHCLVNGA